MNHETCDCTQNSRSDYPAFTITTFTQEFVDNLVAEIDSYFPEGDLEMFSCFLPANLPRNIGQVAKHALCIMELAQRLELTEDYVNYCFHKRKDDPVQFWSRYLNKPGMGSELEKLIQKVLVIPVV